MAAGETEPSHEFREIRCAHSESLPALPTQLRLSVLISAGVHDGRGRGF